MPDLPTRIVTFLFSDVENGERLSERYPAAIQPALTAYRDIVRRAIVARGGHVYYEMGDALRASFAEADSALEAALDAQRDLVQAEWPGTGPLPIRMVLQTGSIWAPEGDYVGITANRAARLLQVARGGQVLLSTATWQHIHSHLLDKVQLRDLGEHGLGGLVQPEHIFQLVFPDLPIESAPLRSLDTLVHNLPVRPGSFVGRERTVDEVERLIATTRLLTLTGAGGVGKTRLALQVACDMLGVFEDGVWLVELCGVSDGALVSLAVASVLNVHEEAERPLLETLTRHLRDQSLLLILDCCEHVIEACAELSEALLYACPRLRLLVTSREPLDIPDEVTWTVFSLSLPEMERLSFSGRDFVSALTEYDAVRLFVERARMALPTFTLTMENVLTVAQICRRLDGIPLAIELVASIVKLLPIEKIAHRLTEYFRLLTGGRHTAMPRDRTLWVVIGWSYSLLSEAEQALLRRLSVFVGGCTVEAAEIVCWGRGLETEFIADLLTELELKSLVTIEQRGERPRYLVLEMIRQYCRDKLLDSGETDWVQGRFLDYYLRLAEEAETKLQSAEQFVWLDRLEVEYDNLRAALEWGQASPADAEAGLRLASALWRFWYLRGKLSEGRLWLEGALTGARGGSLARAKVFNVAGHLAYAQGDLVAARLFYEESLAIRRESGDKRGMINSLGSLGQVLKAQGEYGQAERLYEESLAVSREMGSEESIAAALYDLGGVLLGRGSYQRAGSILLESLRLWREIGHADRIVACLVSLSQVVSMVGSVGKQASPEAALKAARLLGAASILLDTIDSPLSSDRAEYDQSMAVVRACLGETAFAQAWAEGRAMTREQAIAYALGE